MDSLDSPTRTTLRDAADAPDTATMPMAALRRNLLELRKHARQHEREDLTACLTLAISLAGRGR